MLPAFASSSPVVRTPGAALDTATQVVLADDHHLVRAGIEALLRRVPGVQVVAQASSGEELLSVLERVNADLLVTDIDMPGTDGVEVIAQVRALHPTLPILVLSMHDTPEFVQRAVASGANGYLTKTAASRELQHAVCTVRETGSYYNADVVRLLLQREETCASDGLTQRQMQIVVLIAGGLSTKDIAQELGLSPKTVDVHRGRIMDRLEVRDIASLTRYAVRRGLIKP
jgi:DNA-binding NarL/FixJ family response regulator